MHFQRGRLLWIANKDTEAVQSFLEADKLGHIAAAKFLGDAYFDERGLPQGIEASDEAALALYQKAKNGGYAGIGSSIAMAEDRIRRSKFNPALFQYQEYMEAIYQGNFDDFKAPIGLAYYSKGLINALDAEPSFFMDLKCKPLLNIIGNNVAEYADLIAAAVQVGKSKDRSGEQILATAVRGLFDNAVSSVYVDYGKRDGIVLFDKDIYGCDSPVTKKIAANLMNRLKLVK